MHRVTRPLRDRYSKRYRGQVTYRVVEEATGKVVKTVTRPNIITYQGADFFAKASAGLPEYKFTHIYGEHADPGFSGYIEGSLNGLVTDRTDTVDVLRTSPRDTVDAEAQILVTSFATSDPLLYSHNLVTILAVWDSSAVNGEIFVGAGLICKLPDGTEILVAHNYVPALIKLAGFAIQAVWTIELL